MEETTYAQLRRFAQVIRTGRERLGDSQEQFAERCGTFRTYIGKLERAEHNPTFAIIVRIARALKVKPSALWRRAGL